MGDLFALMNKAVKWYEKTHAITLAVECVLKVRVPTLVRRSS